MLKKWKEEITVKIKVPATSANLGPGFDSIGIAVSLYLTIEVIGTAEKWHVFHDLGHGLSNSKSNLVVSTALKIAPNLTPHELKMTSDIPVTRGLGSSSSAIVAGIELANQLAGLNLTDQQKIDYAAEMEGHPDNVAPAIYGDLVIGSSVNDKFIAIQAPFPDLSLVAYVPAYELKTSDSRGVLPNNIAFANATHASAIGNTFVASIFTKKYQELGKLIEADMFHEPYRQKLVPEFLPIRKIAHEVGALATYLSGAGPTVMTIIDADKIPQFQESLLAVGCKDDVIPLKIDKNGVTVEK